MNSLLNSLLEISLASSILIAVVLILRKLFKNKLGPTVRYGIWLVVVLRLLMPFTIPSPLSLMNILDFNRQDVVSTPAAAPLNNQIAETGIIPNQNFTPAVNPPIQRGFEPGQVISLAWLMGIICVAGYMVFINVAYLKKATKNCRELPPEKQPCLEKILAELKIKQKLPVLVNDKIASPCLIGWFKPKIVLNSQSLEREKSLKHVLLHELCHYKQGDNWLALLRNICCAVYWFNPLVWIGAAACREDSELACDERVLRRLADAENTDYAETLLNLIRKNELKLGVMHISTTMTWGGKKMKERIDQIIKRPKTIKAALVWVIVILLAAGGCTLSSPAPIKTDDSVYDTNILEKLAAYKTPYLGDSSKIGGMIESLPQPSVFHRQNMFSLETDREPYELTVYYEPNDYTGASEPFWYSKMDNNALILFAFIDNLEYITFAYRNTPSNGELNPAEYEGSYAYSRAVFSQRFGDLKALGDDLASFKASLVENLKIDPFRIHYNRISFESTYEHVIYRNGDPDEVIRNEDNSLVMVYENLGAGEHYSPDGELLETIKGNDLTIYLDSDERVYAAYIEGGSEILSGLGIEGDLSYAGITQKLGQPQIAENNNSVISYQLFDSGNRYVIFYFDQSGNLAGHGFNTGKLAI